MGTSPDASTNGCAPLTMGNAAKLYTLNVIDAMATAAGRPLRVLDVGSGTSRNFVALLSRHPDMEYVGVEPSSRDVAVARQVLAGAKATIICGWGYRLDEMVRGPFDVVTSFSVLEHVYQRQLHLSALAGCMDQDSVLLMNYDSGHFCFPSGWRDRAKNLVGPALARLGKERYYQRLVTDEEFRSYLEPAGLAVAEDKVFNSFLKSYHRLVSSDAQGEHMHRWLDYELWINSLPTKDSYYPTKFATRFWRLRRR